MPKLESEIMKTTMQSNAERDERMKSGLGNGSAIKTSKCSVRDFSQKVKNKKTGKKMGRRKSERKRWGWNSTSRRNKGGINPVCADKGEGCDVILPPERSQPNILERRLMVSCTANLPARRIRDSARSPVNGCKMASGCRYFGPIAFWRSWRRIGICP